MLITIKFAVVDSVAALAKNQGDEGESEYTDFVEKKPDAAAAVLLAGAAEIDKTQEELQ